MSANVPPARAGGTLVLGLDDVGVVAPGGGLRGAATAAAGVAWVVDEASDDIEAFDLAVLEVAKAEHRARRLLSQLVHVLPFSSGLVEPMDKEGVTSCDAP
jgi:hypothetical protein